MFMPLRNGSVLEAFSLICSMLGGTLWSAAMSEKFKCTAGSYEVVSGMVISPERRNPKKHKRKALQSMMLSKSSGC